jgi:hypothetical protein
MEHVSPRKEQTTGSRPAKVTLLQKPPYMGIALPAIHGSFLITSPGALAALQRQRRENP